MLLQVLYPAGCALMIIGLFAQRRGRWIRPGMALMIIGASLGVSDVVAAVIGGEQWAVILEQAKGYAGDGQTYSVIVDSIVPGQEVKIVEPRRDWIQVELPSGTRCWLQAALCEPVHLNKSD
jgi:hypothetical protein